MGAFNDGKKSGVTAGDLTGAPDIGKVAPGQTKGPHGPEVGSPWIDHDLVCAGKDKTTAGCFLEDGQRQRLTLSFLDRVQTARNNYKDALIELRVDELMKKDDDLHWVLSIALDVAGAHVLGMAMRALQTAKAANVVKRGAETLIAAVSDKTIESLTKTGFDVAKKKLSKGVQEALNVDDATDKTNSLSFIAQLRNNCDIGFTTFADRALNSAPDAELVVLWEGMHESNHTHDAYVAELGGKLARYKKSGVTDLGRALTHDRETGYVHVRRDTRVVWVKNTPGTGRTLYYQSQEGNRDPSVVHREDPGTESLFPEHAKWPHAFGPRAPRESPTLGRPVPAEFVETAVMRSEQLWGVTETIEPTKDWLTANGYDLAYRPASPAPGLAPSTTQVIYSMLVGDDDDREPVGVFKPRSVFVQQQDSP